MKVTLSKTCAHPQVVKIILRNTPTLDPLAILLNSDLYILEEGSTIVAFSTLKKMGTAYELGTVYTHEDHRGRGYASLLIRRILEREDSIHVLCRESLSGFYTRLGFRERKDVHSMVQLRKYLFNLLLRPICGYSVCSLGT